MVQKYLKSIIYNEYLIKKLLILLFSCYLVGLGFYLLTYLPFPTIGIILLTISIPIAVRNVTHIIISFLHLNKFLNNFLFSFSLFCIGLLFFILFTIINTTFLFILSFIFIIVGTSLF